ncbi:diacylglycerol/lipid kinase family protein [Dyella sp.]|uniref:diacylglycerol/lipid kinase family protein n=1 Tax=Dyella sp. TaxID=1869338 RepID=UPI002D7853D5|nr:diacylglycerol kinase family protein [Dyella sp.]HET6432735.1 diacylglycerol kinase family protein [Dyella sp.]
MLAAHAPLFIVLNKASGHGDASEVEQSIRRSLDDAGRTFRILRVDDPSQLGELADQAVALAREQDGAVIVVGGDGTINAVTQAVLPGQVPFGVLPQGTFNFFGRTHGLPQGDAGKGVRELLEADEQPAQAGLVNGRAFLVNASLGLYPSLLEQREGAKQQFGRHRLVALGSGLRTLLQRFPRLRLRMRGDAPAGELSAMTLVVGNNRLQLEKIGIEQASAVERGRLVGIAVRPVGRLSLVWMAIRGLLGHLGDFDRVDSFAFEELTVDLPRRRRIKVALDGEICSLDLPLRFSVAPQSLRLLVPRNAEPEQAA